MKVERLTNRSSLFRLGNFIVVSALSLKAMSTEDHEIRTTFRATSHTRVPFEVSALTACQLSSEVAFHLPICSNLQVASD